MQRRWQFLAANRNGDILQDKTCPPRQNRKREVLTWIHIAINVMMEMKYTVRLCLAHLYIKLNEIQQFPVNPSGHKCYDRFFNNLLSNNWWIRSQFQRRRSRPQACLHCETAGKIALFQFKSVHSALGSWIVITFGLFCRRICIVMLRSQCTSQWYIMTLQRLSEGVI